MPADPADTVVAARLAFVLGNEWAVGTNIFTGPVRPASSGIPHQAVFCLSSGGVQPSPYLGGPGAEKFSRPRVQVRVRSNPGEFANGLALARSVSAGLDRAPFPGYLASFLQQSEPNYLGQDAQDHHEWSVNVELWLVA